MLGLAVKNVILFTLIILIFHFLIKNAIVDRFPGSKPPMPLATLPTAHKENFVGQIRQEKQDGSALYDDEKKKMMSYIMQEAENDLDSMFAQKIITQCDKEGAGECPAKKDNAKLPLSTTCDANIQELKPEDPMKLKADCKLPQDHKGFMLIKEYENEKVLNGGALFDGLQAYDSYDEYFSQAMLCDSGR